MLDTVNEFLMYLDAISAKRSAPSLNMNKYKFAVITQGSISLPCELA